MLQKFKEHLNNNPRLAQSSKNVYYKAIKELVNDYGESPSIEQLNKFIAIKCNKRQSHVKYAIKEYLKYINRTEDYSRIVQAKVRMSIKEKVFLSKAEAFQIINSIKNEQHRAIALIQYNTGARASEIITIEKKHIKFEKYQDNGNEKDRVRIMIRGKGDKPRYIYLLPSLWKNIDPFYTKARRLLFIDDEGLVNLGFWSRVETAYKRYYESLQAAAKSCGFDIGTHDLRRSFANDLLKATNQDLFLVQKTLGHKDPMTTTRYLQNRNEAIAESMLEYQKEYY